MTHIFRLLVLMLLLVISISSQANNYAEWMRSNWGIRIVLPAGNNNFVDGFVPDKLVRQLSELNTVKWVMINATQGGYGGYLTTNNKRLNRDVDHFMTPDRDLLQECIALLRGNGYRVIIYFASEGPLGVRPDESDDIERAEIIKIRAKNRPLIDAWSSYLKNNNLTNEEAIAERILEPIAIGLGAKADGWWFDHGKWADPSKLVEKVRKYNPKTAIAWNEEHEIIHFDGTSVGMPVNKVWGLKRSNKYEDYTAGHVTPPKRMAPWNDANALVVQQIEKSDSAGVRSIDGLVPHWLIPMQRDWRKGDAGFSTEKVIDWTARIISSEGAITWSVALKHPEFKTSEIDEPQLKQLKELDEYLLKNGLVPLRKKARQ